MRVSLAARREPAGPENPAVSVQQLPFELRPEAAEVSVWNGGVVWQGLVKSSARLPQQRGSGGALAAAVCVHLRVLGGASPAGSRPARSRSHPRRQAAAGGAGPGAAEGWAAWAPGP